MKLINIEISKLPGVYPINYTDAYQQCESYVQRMPYVSEIATTEWDFLKDIRVYSRIWDAYRLELRMPDYVFKSLQNMNYASEVKIYYDNSVIHDAYITKINIDEIKGYYYKVTIEYKDLSSVKTSNFFDFINYPSLLTGDYVTLKLENKTYSGANKSIDAQWTSIINPVTKDYKVYSTLKLISDVSDPDVKDDNDTGTRLTSQTFIGNTIKARFFLNETQKNNVKKYLNLCSNITLIQGLISYSVTENINPDVEQIGEGVYKIDIVARIENLVYNHY